MGEKTPFYYIKKILKWAAISLTVLFALAFIASQAPKEEAKTEMPTKIEDSAAAKVEAVKKEDGFSGGFANIRVLDDAMLDQVKIQALAAGKNPASLYPGNGPMAIIVLPIHGFNLGDIQNLAKLICPVTFDKDPESWREYSDVLILNRHAYAGFSVNMDIICADEVDLPRAINKSVIGEWECQIPYKLADKVDTVGYGNMRL